MKTFRDIVFKISGAFEKIASACIALNMMVIVISVLGRVLFKSPILGLTDIVAFAFGLSCAFAFCITEKRRGHISMDLLLTHLPRKGKIVNHVAVGVLNLFTLGVLTIILFRYIGSTFNNHMVSWVLHIPYYPFVAAAAIGMLLFLATALANFFTIFDELKKTGDVTEENEVTI